jgi:anti-anti-sigma factor
LDTRDIADRDKKATMDIGVREKGRVLIVDLAGEIRLTDGFTPSLQRLIAEHLAAGKANFLLNFTKVDFIDSYGIGDIVAAYLAVREKGGKFKMAGLSSKIWLIFHYSGLTKIFETFDTEDKALKSFA